MQPIIRPSPGIALYAPFFRSRNPRRNEEFLVCLKQNALNPLIERIHLLVDDGHDPDFFSKKIEVVRLGARPTYKDWLRLALRKSKGRIAVLANTDIYFDESIGGLSTLLDEPLKFVALSRHDMVGGGFELHRHPEWSQDAWALAFPEQADESLVKALDFPLGVPRCDGKVAYTFLLRGYKLHNPCLQVRSYHVHDTPVRDYSRRGDRTILGGIAYVHPAENLCAPSRVEIHIWGCDHSQISRVALNRSIEKWGQSGVIDHPNAYVARVGCVWLDAEREGVAGVLGALGAMRRPSKHRVRLILERGGGWQESEIAEILDFVGGAEVGDWFDNIEFLGGCDPVLLPQNGADAVEPVCAAAFFARVERVLGAVRGVGAVLRYATDSVSLRDDWLDVVNRRLRVPAYHDVVLVSEQGEFRDQEPTSPAGGTLRNLILCAGNPVFKRFLEEWKLVSGVPGAAAAEVGKSGTGCLPGQVDGASGGRPCLAGLGAGRLILWKTAWMPALQDLPKGLGSFGVEPLTLRVLCPLEPDAVILRAPDAASAPDVWRSVAGWKQRGVAICDRDWQYPAITEKHAAAKARALLRIPEGHTYFGFPWAALIDLLLWNKKDAGSLMDALATYGRLFRASQRVVTVCQHIHMFRFQDLFAEAGVTDVFWSHATKDGRRFPDHPGIRVHPFPLYPVQCTNLDWGREHRKHLFSFVGARSGKSYLTRSRDFIIDLLGNDSRGVVKSRDEWHYNKVVYDYQIRKSVSTSEGLVCEDSSAEFLQILRQSVFSLCPSGSGPNSIRLWESIGAGAIPVILADTYLPPGESALWEEAAVFCEETEEAVATLPVRLAKIAGDAAELARKRSAMKRIWERYGPDRFIHDIQRLFSRCKGEFAAVGAGHAGPVIGPEGKELRSVSSRASEELGLAMPQSGFPPAALTGPVPVGNINIIGFSLTGFGEPSSFGALLQTRLATRGWRGQVREISYGGLSINGLAGFTASASQPVQPGDVVFLEIATSFFSQQKHSVEQARPFVFAIAEYYARQACHHLAFLNLFRVDLDDNDCVVRAIREASHYFGIPILDLKARFRSFYPAEPWGTTDGVHPDQASRERIAAELLNYLDTAPLEIVKPRPWEGQRYQFVDAAGFAQGRECFMYSGRGKSVNSVVLRTGEAMEIHLDAPGELEGVYFLYGPETGYLLASVDGAPPIEIATFDEYCYYRRVGFRPLRRVCGTLRLEVSDRKPSVVPKRETKLEIGPRSEFVCGILVRTGPGGRAQG